MRGSNQPILKGQELLYNYRLELETAPLWYRDHLKQFLHDNPHAADEDEDLNIGANQTQNFQNFIWHLNFNYFSD